MPDLDAIKKAAEEQGYTLAHFQESYGNDNVGLIFLVKLNREFVAEDQSVMFRAGDVVRLGLQTVSAKIDPDGPQQRARHREEISEIYLQAGETAIYMEELPNGYCSYPCCLNRPWFRVTSRIGHVVIGWRKRVFEIDWKDSMVKKSGAELFPNESVTRSETGIHAHSADKASEYIRTLHGESR